MLERDVPGGGYQDAMGLYPFFSCKNWDKLRTDVEEIQNELVALSLITDPMAEVDQGLLASIFPEHCRMFKEHFAIDLTQPSVHKTFSTNHKRNAQKAFKQLDVRRCSKPGDYFEDWLQFYRHLIERHEITGMTAFSEKCFSRQFETPGLIAYRASRGADIVGMNLWYVTEAGHAYYHLGAYSDVGYEAGASFALFWQAIEDFMAEGIRYLCLGAGAGSTPKGDDGLTRFKRGWANTIRSVYFCGRIFNPGVYNDLTKRFANPGTHFFPAYREGEF